MNAYNELLHVPLHAHVRQIWHHVGDYFEASVLRKVERLAHSSHRVASGRNTHTYKTQKYTNTFKKKPEGKNINHHPASERLISHHVWFLIYVRPFTPLPPNLLTCWCRGPRLHTHSGLLSPAGCSRSPTCHWGVAWGSSRAASQWWFPHTWCYCAQSTCKENTISVILWYYSITLALRSEGFFLWLLSLGDYFGLLYMLGSLSNINLHAVRLHGSLATQLSLTSH